jgi:Ser/Thr protein kinase RdoA (MazF antagonist)
VRPGLNDSYLVVSAGRRYVARLYGAHRDGSEVAYELELLCHLAGAGVPVAEPLAAADGELTCAVEAPEGPRRLAVFRFAEGEPISWRLERHCGLAGRLAATIHRAADGFRTAHRRPALDLERLADAPLRTVEPFLRDRPADRAFLAGLADALHGHVALAVERGLDQGPCHGDFGAKNILIAGGSLTALDFDMCGPGWRAYDLTSVYRAAREAGEDRLWRSFVDGYTAVRPLSASDLAAVPLFRLLRDLGMLGLFASNAARWGALSLADAEMDRWLATLRKLAAELGPAPGSPRPARSARPGARPAPRRGRAAGAAAAAVAYSLLAEEAVAAEVARSYRIGAPVTCRLLKRGLNDTYLVLAPRRCIARVHRAGAASAEEVGYELALLAHLSREGMHVATPVPAADGAATVPLAAAEGARRLVLFAHSDGAPLTWRPEDARRVGSLAARIHAASAGFSDPGPRTPLDLERLVSRPLAALRPFLEARKADWLLLCRVADRLRALAEAAARDGLDWGPCHGDLRPERIHVDAGGRATVVGFDQCGPGWRVYDLSMVRWGCMGRGGRGYWRSFLRGYAEVRPIGRREIEAVPVFHALRRLAALGGRAERAGVWGTRQIGPGVIDEELAFLRAWESTRAGGADGG